MPGENQPPEATNAKNGPDKEATLHYIDKAYDMYAKACGLATRLGLTLVIASSLMLTISIGWVSAKESFSLGGLGLKVSLAALLGGAIVLIASVYLAFYAALVRIDALSKEIPKLYRTIGYRETSITDDLTGLVGYDLFFMLVLPGSSRTSQSKLVRFFELALAWVVLLGLLVLLPIVAEGAMLWRLAWVVGWDRFYIWLPFVVFVVIVPITPMLLSKRWG